MSSKFDKKSVIEIMGAIGPGGFKFSAEFSGSIDIIPEKLALSSIILALELSGQESSVKLSCTLQWHDKDILGDDKLAFQG